METMKIDPTEDRSAGFILTPKAMIERGTAEDTPELCSSADKAATIDSSTVTLRTKGGDMAKGKVDWYYVRLQGAATLPHALLGLMKGSLSSTERASLQLDDKSGLDKTDVELLRSHGLLEIDAESQKPVIPRDLKRVIRASMQLKVEDRDNQIIKLRIRKPYSEQAT